MSNIMTDPIEIDLNEEIKVDTNTNDDNTLQLVDNAFALPLKIAGFHSEKEFDVFIKSVERLVRFSIEYKLWVSYITDSLGYNKCVLTHEKMAECDLDVHHHPINLYTVTKCVINDYLNREQKFTTFEIATSVIELHYQNKIGYMVLLSDLHKKFHGGFQKLPIDYVNGDFHHLLNHFNIDEDQRRIIGEYCNTNVGDCKMDWTREDYPGLAEKIA